MSVLLINLAQGEGKLAHGVGGDVNQGFWEEVQAVYSEVAEADATLRRRLLDERCAGRPDLRAEVESLLTSSDEAGSFLEVAGRDRFVGQTIAGFTLTEQIGQGGMGAVYAAKRASGEFDQRVAVKLVDLPVRHEEGLRRFRAERQFLAALNHPHIVTFLDGGITPEGQAYLVMEFVEGVPITRYCADRTLSLEDRLRLFQRVCSAVQHAHQHAIVHRDLKPGNILVTDAGAPKMLDFGVAKLLDTDQALPDATTGSPFRALTPNYASPEQLRGLPVTTAADIYALGVLLFEILAGARPYDTGGKPYDEVLKLVVEGGRRRPSESASHGTALPYAAGSLKGDLDAIVMKAMSVEPERRYASAGELADDVGRYLAAVPVVAREPSFGYLVAHLARRHRAAVIAGGISAAALVIALGISLYQTHIARTERRRAEQRFGDARQLASAVIFGIHDEILKLPGSTAVRQKIVAEALAYLERLSSDPAGDDAFRIELARAYYRVGSIQGSPVMANLGDRKGAQASFEKAIAILQPIASDPSRPVEAAYWLADIQLSLASVVGSLGNGDEAKRLVHAGTASAEALMRRPDPEGRARRLLGRAYFDQAMILPPADRVDAWQKAGAIYDAMLAEKPADPIAQRNVALVAKYLGSTYEVRQEYALALTHHRKALAMDEQRLAANPSHRTTQFDVAIDYSNVAFNAWQTGQLADAAAGYERSVEIRRRLALEDPKDELAQSRLAYAEMRLARVYSQQGRYDVALKAAREAMTFSDRVRNVDATGEAEHASNLVYFGDVLKAAGRQAEACSAFTKSAAIVAALEKAGTADANQTRVDEVRRNLKGRLPCK